LRTKHLTVMFTDIKGFTSRTSHSTREKLERILDLHEQLIKPIFEKFEGNIIKTIGDAFMVTFDSPTDALLCGMKIQKTLTEHNASADPEDRLEVRVAINSGEVTMKNGDVFGEAVNIASRLEGVADAGDIYFTESVYLAMNKSEIPTAEVGYRHFKGVPDEVKVYKVLMESKKKLFKRDKLLYLGSRQPTWKKVLKWAAIVFIILIILNILGQKNNPRPEGDVRPELKAQEAREHLEMLVGEAESAINEGDRVRARQILNKLHEANEKLGHPPELEETLSNLERFFEERFRR